MRVEEQGTRVEVKRFVTNAEAASQRRLTTVVVRAMLVFTVLAFFGAFLEPKNKIEVTLAVYLPIFAILGTAWLFTKRDQQKKAGWIVSVMFWAVCFASTWFFGGLNYEIGSSYVVVIMVASATLGSRAGVYFGVVCVLSAGLVAWADQKELLPPPMSPMTPMNSWISITVALMIAAVLQRMIARGSREAWLSSAKAIKKKEVAEEKYLHAQKVAPIARLASGVAHDFNNLLNVMTGVSSLLRDATEEERDELLDELDLATTRATLMTGQLLALNKKSPVEPRAVELSPLLETLTPLLSRMVGDTVQIELERGSGDTTVLTDPGQVEQLILNLAVNGREAMPSGGTLTLTLDVLKIDSETWVRLKISDTGEGIPPEIVEKVFEPFFSTKDKGTGLGLATVNDIVRRHQGTIHIESSPGNGTSFEILFPHHERQEEKIESSEVSTITSQSARVLLVEDHDVGRRTIRRTLEAGGHDVTTVANGQEALSLVEGGATFELIVSDVSMPKMDGTQLALSLDRVASDTPILFVSGHVQELPQELAPIRARTSFLPKPFNGEALKVRVAQMIRAKARESGQSVQPAS